MARYAVGDIQGCLTPLQKLLEQVCFDPGQDELWCVGDIVNRGPASLETLRFLHSLGPAVQIVLGNHDLHLLAVAAGVRPTQRSDTLAPILSAPDREPLLDWLRRQPLLWCSADGAFTLVHAGLPPHWTVAEAVEHAQEVSTVLQSPLASDFLQGMYGNQPERWEPSLQGFDRLRVITNIFTRMRFIRADGSLDLVSKGPPSTAPSGYMPWFDVPAAQWRHDAGTVLFGHWATLNGAVTDPQLLALDTGCVWGNRLTLVNVDSGQQWQQEWLPG